jgi:hypothetical protein
MAVEDFDNASGTADANDASGHGEEHAKFVLRFQAAVDHAPVTRFEDVQGKRGAGQEDDV